MKKLAILLTLSILFIASVDAQFYSGKFTSEPKLEDFEHFVVVQHPHHDKYGGTLTVKAFVKSGVLWHSQATPVEAEVAMRFKKEFGRGLDILSVYQLNVGLDGETWEFFMLGYEKDKHHGSFVVVEEIFDDITDSEPVEINAFIWDQITAKK